MVRGVATTLALVLALPLGAEVYRCEVDGVASFSDRPCGPDSALYTDAGAVSYIAPDENLPALAEAAQAFIRKRRERIARRNTVQPAPQAQPGAVERQVETVLVPWMASSAHGYRWHRKPGRNPGNFDRPTIAGNNRYSPLNGPILGTRPESAAFAGKNAPRDGRRR